MSKLGHMTATARPTTWVPSIEPITGGGAIPTWTLADRLRKAREWAQHDQATLAELMHVQRSTVSALENGHRKPANATIRLWAVATGVNVEWLETGAAPSPDDDGASSYTPSDSNREPAD